MDVYERKNTNYQKKLIEKRERKVLKDNQKMEKYGIENMWCSENETKEQAKIHTEREEAFKENAGK